MNEDLKEVESCESVSDIHDLCDQKIAFWSALQTLAGIACFAAFVCFVLFPSVPDIPYTEIFACCMASSLAFFLFSMRKKQAWLRQKEAKTESNQKNE